MVDENKLDDEDFLYIARMAGNIDWESLNQQMIETSDISFLINRGVSMDTIRKFNVTTCDLVPDEYKILCGITPHSANRTIRDREVKGFTFPVYNLNGTVIGAGNRFTTLLPEQKWGFSIPCFYLYNNMFDRDPADITDIYICEGIFDGYALEDYTDVSWISLGSGYFSEFHYINMMIMLINVSNLKHIHLLLDTDGVGTYSMLMANQILSKIFEDVTIHMYVCPKSKDISEHFCRDGKKLEDFIELQEDELIKKHIELKRYNNAEARYADYLKNRKLQISPEVYNYRDK
jgi:hypothetical protein